MIFFNLNKNNNHESRADLTPFQKVLVCACVFAFLSTSAYATCITSKTEAGDQEIKYKTIFLIGRINNSNKVYENKIKQAELERKTAESEILLSEKHRVISYLIDIKNANKIDANTDEIVLISLYGSEASIENLRLDNPDLNDFEKENIDRFLIRSSKNIGDLNSIKLEIKDNDGDGKIKGWLPEYIFIKNISSGQSWNFKLNQWLDDEAGHQPIIERSK